MINSGQRPPAGGSQGPLTGAGATRPIAPGAARPGMAGAPMQRPMGAPPVQRPMGTPPAGAPIQRPMGTPPAQRPMGAPPVQRPMGAPAQRPMGTAPAGAAPARTAAPGAARPGMAGAAQRPMGAAPAGAAQRPAAMMGAAMGAARPAAGGQKVTVGIADMKMLQGDGELITYALGSCIGICLHDPEIRLGALVHIMLPLNMEANRKNTMKYADTGIKETVAQLIARGARKERLVAKIAGGAKMFEIAGNGDLGNIGARNIESVKLNLQKHGIRILSENVGGSVARTLSFYPGTGVGEIRAYGQPVITL